MNPSLTNTALTHTVQEIERDGFSIVPNAIGPEQIEALKPAIDRAIEQEQAEFGGRPGKHEFIAWDLVMKGPEFVRLLENPIMLQVFRAVLGDGCVLYACATNTLQSGAENYTTEVHVDTARFAPDYTLGLICTFALVDFEEDNGATWYLPGSHRQRERPSDEEFYAGAVRVVRKAGDVVIFNPRVWHRGGLNMTPDARYACSFFGVRQWMKQRLDYPRMVTPEIIESLSDSGRRFLGLEAQVPTNLDEFYVPMDERLYIPRPE
ncbi:MAG: hypothetical protein HKN26_00875 [Acidimicrobiales bacterium]|nr:hypothetical protein [Acidimicrobiales bacterium]